MQEDFYNHFFLKVIKENFPLSLPPGSRDPKAAISKKHFLRMAL